MHTQTISTSLGYESHDVFLNIHSQVVCLPDMIVTTLAGVLRNVLCCNDASVGVQ